MSASDSPDHPASILYRSESSEAPYSTNQLLVGNFFCRFLRQTGSNIEPTTCLLRSAHVFHEKEICQFVFLIFTKYYINGLWKCQLSHFGDLVLNHSSNTRFSLYTVLSVSKNRVSEGLPVFCFLVQLRHICEIGDSFFL